MIVRLKVDKEIVSGLKNAFQFYDSPIKSYLYGQDGIIIKIRFNSMIVRLKANNDTSRVFWTVVSIL